MQNLSLLKRKTESIHTEETYSSPSKRLKLSTFRQNLRFWSSKDTPSGSDMAGPNGELTWKTEDRGTGGRMNEKKSFVEFIVLAVRGWSQNQSLLGLKRKSLYFIFTVNDFKIYSQ